MDDLVEFRGKYPLRTMRLTDGGDFRYRYHRNPRARATLVLLPGGIGLSDLFYLHVERFAEEYSVITFDYQERFATNAELARAIAELLDRLDERVWLVGQSLGGVIAQILAKSHPERIEGFVLSNTCSLARDMGGEARAELMAMVADQRKWKRRLALVPMPLFKRLMTWAVMRKTRDLSTQERRLMQGLCDALRQLLSKSYQRHMADLLIDAASHADMVPADFERWRGRVLLILSEDDHTFNQANKDALIRLMPDPTVITDLTGGHLALMVRMDKYVQAVSDFID